MQCGKVPRSTIPNLVAATTQGLGIASFGDRGHACRPAMRVVPLPTLGAAVVRTTGAPIRPRWCRLRCTLHFTDDDDEGPEGRKRISNVVVGTRTSWSRTSTQSLVLYYYYCQYILLLPLQRRSAVAQEIRANPALGSWPPCKAALSFYSERGRAPPRNRARAAAVRQCRRCVLARTRVTPPTVPARGVRRTVLYHSHDPCGVGGLDGSPAL
jgi:hypothetical protein